MEKRTERVASFYENKIKIEGYNDTIPNKANIYVINRAQELSDPVEVTFTPLESSLSKAIKTISIVQDFGGAQYELAE